MLRFFFCYFSFFIISSSFNKAYCQETDQNVNRSITEMPNEKIVNDDFKNTNVTDVEDVFDDYMKIVIYENLQFRSAVTNTEKIWEDGIVPYVISDEYSKENKNFILKAMEEFHEKTCVRFQQREKEKSYIMLVPGSGCSAVVGKIPNKSNRVTMHANCFVKGIVFHELMHALGFIHEQNRPDRDEFVRIVFENIKSGSVRNFDKYSADEIQLFNLAYDYGSVMHYGTNDFAVNKSRPTIIPLKNDVAIGQRRGFSERDLIKINLMYNCSMMESSTNGPVDAKENSTGITDDKIEKSARATDDTEDNSKSSEEDSKTDYSKSSEHHTGRAVKFEDDKHESEELKNSTREPSLSTDGEDFEHSERKRKSRRKKKRNILFYITKH